MVQVEVRCPVEECPSDTEDWECPRRIPLPVTVEETFLDSILNMNGLTQCPRGHKVKWTGESIIQEDEMEWAVLE